MLCSLLPGTSFHHSLAGVEDKKIKRNGKAGITWLAIMFCDVMFRDAHRRWMKSRYELQFGSSTVPIRVCACEETISFNRRFFLAAFTLYYALPLSLLLPQPLASSRQLRPLILHQQGFPQEIPDPCSQRYWTACHIPHTLSTRACIVGSSVRSPCPSPEYAWQLDGCFMPRALQTPSWLHYCPVHLGQAKHCCLKSCTLGHHTCILAHFYFFLDLISLH